MSEFNNSNVHRLTRGKHKYSIPVQLSDIMEPIAIVYGTFLPVTLFASLHFLVVSPYLKRKKVC